MKSALRPCLLFVAISAMIGCASQAPKPLVGADLPVRQPLTGELAKEAYDGSYWSERASYPTGHFNPHWLVGAADQASKVQQSLPAGIELQRSAGRALDPGNFTPLGPRPLGSGGGVAGRTNVVVSHPTNPAIAWIGSDGGGVWKTTNCCDASTTWVNTTDNSATLEPIQNSAIGDLTLDPNNPNVLYAGTGDLRYGSYSFGSNGVLKSVDGGDTWTVKGETVFNPFYPPSANGVPQYQAIGKVAVDPNNSNIVIVGATPQARRMIDANRRTREVNIVGIFDDRQSRSPSRLAGVPYLGTLDDLANWKALPEVDRILITVRPDAIARVRDLLGKLSPLPHPIGLSLEFGDEAAAGASLASIADSPAAQLSGRPANPDWLIVKRLEDLVIGSLMFLAALPVMAVIALVVRLDSPGPILFRQVREGFNGRPIGVLKFRSMRHSVEGEKSGVRQVERDDPRVTRIGRILRATSLDELPQLWNVLKGEMSLVGPRPHAPGMKTGATLTSNLVAEYAHRHRVKPGLTGWAQVNGSRGPLHSPEAARERVKLDVEYIARASLWFDLWIMLRTLPALLGDKINIR